MVSILPIKHHRNRCMRNMRLLGRIMFAWHTTPRVLSNGTVRTATPDSVPLHDCEHSSYNHGHCNTHTHMRRQCGTKQWHPASTNTTCDEPWKRPDCRARFHSSCMAAHNECAHSSYSSPVCIYSSENSVVSLVTKRERNP